jgi:hypothetical protein
MHSPTPNAELQPLPRPFHRKWQHQVLQRQMRRLFSCQNRFYDVWCQQRQPNDTADERRPNAFCLSDFVQTPIGAVFQQFLPAKCPRDRLDHGVVYGRQRCRISLSSIWQHDDFSPTPFLERHWHFDGDHFHGVRCHHAAFLLSGITDRMSSRMPAVFISILRPVGLTVTRSTSS